MSEKLSNRTELKERYTAVVVGSGYGAGVAASRLARAGQTVAVLERGREIRPGDYPNDLATAQREMQIDTARGKLGTADGLFNVHVNPDMVALVGCGLGGTSLINANVALEMDTRLFDPDPPTCDEEPDLPRWPNEFRDDKNLLASAYERARQMLDAKPYPNDFPRLNKLAALEKSAATMKQTFYRPPIAVNFEDQMNPFGVAQPKCVGCGDCCSGCNIGAKNTTLMNYLPDAVEHGAEIFAGIHVDWIEREGQQWRVHFSPYDSRYGTDQQGQPGSVLADVVMLGAGSLGSTEILLRSKECGLTLSSELGQRFSGNGDVLAFGYDCYWNVKDKQFDDESVTSENINGVGIGANDVPIDHYPGPCITGVIDMRGDSAPKRRLVIEEGVIPGALATPLAPAMFFANALVGNFFQYGADQAESRLLDAKTLGEAFQNDLGSLTARAYAGPSARTQTYLVMSVDDAGGTLKLQDDRLRICWTGAGASEVIANDNERIKQATRAVAGQFFPNPLWTKAMGQQLVTVHPVGGCRMADDAGDGVINHKCQVFSGESGTAVHEGLYVCDGAALPGAVGVNPLLTITAVAERACELLIKERGWNFDVSLRRDRGPLVAAPPATAGSASSAASRLMGRAKAAALSILRRKFAPDWDHALDLVSPAFAFTETMHGWVSTRQVTANADVPANQRIVDDYVLATAWGRDTPLRTPLNFKLTICSDDLSEMINNPTHPAGIQGVVKCDALSASPMKVRKGQFHLLPVDQNRVETWTMTYDMVLDRQAATPVQFHGYKVLHQEPDSNAWADVTTLFVTIHDGDDPDHQGPLLARGILTLDLEDLLWQGNSIAVDLPREWANNLLAYLTNGKSALTRTAGRFLNRLPKSAKTCILERAKSAIRSLYLARFAGFFGMTLFRAYGGMLATLNNFPAADLARRPIRRLSIEPAEPALLALSDGFRIKLTRYEGGARGPVILAPGFGVRASSFAIDTVDVNLVEYLTNNDYDVWLFDFRASPDSGNLADSNRPPMPYTIDDIAAKDWPAAVKHVLAETGAQDLQVLAHCVGSMSLLMALLKGMRGVRSVISSQLTLHPVTDWLNYLKTDINVAGLLDNLGHLRGRIPIVPGDTDLDKQMDVAISMVPVPDGEQCKNPVCRRIFSVFGASYAHNQLNHWTHTAMSEMFGDVAIKPFEHLSLIMEKGKAVDHNGEDVYMQSSQVQNLALPISFVAGAANRLFYPETANATYRWLCNQNDPTLYKFHTIEGYAHMDLFIGRNAVDDVYPFLFNELERFNPMRQELAAERTQGDSL